MREGGEGALYKSIRPLVAMACQASDWPWQCLSFPVWRSSVQLHFKVDWKPAVSRTIPASHRAGMTDGNCSFFLFLHSSHIRQVDWPLPVLLLPPSTLQQNEPKDGMNKISIIHITHHLVNKTIWYQWMCIICETMWFKLGQNKTMRNK